MWQTCHCERGLMSRWSRRDRRPWPARRPSHDRTVLDLADSASFPRRVNILLPVHMYIYEPQNQLLWDRHVDIVVVCIVVLSSFVIGFDCRCCRCCLYYVTVPLFRCTSFSDRFRSTTSSRSHKRKRVSRRARENHEKTVYEDRITGYDRLRIFFVDH